jgi:hypothetical protein
MNLWTDYSEDGKDKNRNKESSSGGDKSKKK